MQISTQKNIPEKGVALGLTFNSVKKKKSKNMNSKQVGLYQDIRMLISLAMSLFFPVIMIARTLHQGNDHLYASHSTAIRVWGGVISPSPAEPGQQR